MKKKLTLTALVTAFALGNLVPYRLGLSAVEAAPNDVIGSPNVAIDTYRNVKGTFILWSSGKITSAEGSALDSDLGHPYNAPPPEAKIGKQTLQPRKVTGSPNVAVKAIPRRDATYILFADGTLRRPANADAAAGDANGVKMYVGGMTGSGTTSCSPGCSATGGVNGLSSVTVDEQLSSKAQILGFANASNTALNTNGSQPILINGNPMNVAGKTVINFPSPGPQAFVTHFVIVDQ